MHSFQSFSEKKSFLLLFFSGLFFLIGCQTDSGNSLDNLVSKTLQVSDAALEQVQNLNSDDAKQEFKKLNQFEYKVSSFKKDISVLELEGSLSLYGAKGYDCSGPLLRAEDILIVCKKRPESLLRYVPQTLVGRP